jgi:hypothetical protein
VALAWFFGCSEETKSNLSLLSVWISHSLINTGVVWCIYPDK